MQFTYNTIQISLISSNFRGEMDFTVYLTIENVNEKSPIKFIQILNFQFSSDFRLNRQSVFVCELWQQKN